MRHIETHCTGAPKRIEADGSTWRENPKETERTGADRNPCTALWTTLSGFESLPPSQPSLALRASFGWQARADKRELQLAGSSRLPSIGSPQVVSAVGP